ncbi:MAG: DUF2281 domain-containing protein [Desulfobacterales bacterium]|nr:DUF2281 domain-containing protein [Desulfobacterales bacterium]
MLTAIKGYYENGKIVLDEQLPVYERISVIVTFLEKITPIRKQRIIGSLKGKIEVPDDFNEPLDDLKEYMY